MKRIGWYFAILLFLATPLFAVQTPFGTVPSLPGTVQAENFDNGNPGEAYLDTTAGNAFGVYRFLDPDVGAIASGGYHIGGLADGEWTEYTVNIPASGNFSLSYRYSSGTTLTTSFQILLGSTVLTTQSVSSTGGWATYVNSPSINVGTLAAGNNQILRINFTRGAFNLDSITFTSTCTKPTVTAPASVTAQPGGTATFSVSTTGATSIRWYRNGVALSDGGKYQGTATNTLRVSNVEQGTEGGQFYAIARNACGDTQSGSATLVVKCDAGDPLHLSETIHRALNPTTLKEYCEWKDAVRPGFSNLWPVNGSYNLPVLANATAFIRAPYGLGTGYSWNMDTFWANYLSRELSLAGTSEWYYQGKEIFSGDYQKFNILAVMAVHYEATRLGKTAVANPARQWLKATFSLMAASAMPQRPTTLFANGLSLNTTDAWTGPYAALAGERTPWGFWTEPNRNIMLAHAIDMGSTGNGWPQLNPIRDTVEQKWAQLSGQTTNAYGISSTEATALRNLINNGTLPSGFIGTYVPATLRTYKVYNIVAWPGARATLLEGTDSTSTVPTFGAVSYGSNAYFLYPWPNVFNGEAPRNVCTGTASLNFAAGTMYASRGACIGGPTEATQNIPTTTRQYWIVLGPGGIQIR